MLFPDNKSDIGEMKIFWAVIPPPDDGETHYTFTVGQRGAPKIIYEGFSFICAKVCNNRKYWVCAKQRSRNCKARLITAKSGKMEVSRNVYHNHGPDAEPGSRGKIETIKVYTDSE